MQVRSLQACYFILGMGLLAACCSIWQCMDYMKALYGVSRRHGTHHASAVGRTMLDLWDTHDT
jgi:hypothetical protein